VEGVWYVVSRLRTTGKSSDAARTITAGLAEFRATGSTFWTPLFLAYLAKAYAELRQLDDAWRSIDEVITAVEATKETLCEAEVHRLAGALLSPELEVAKAEAYFERALAVARQQQAKSWELSAATSLARLWRDPICPSSIRPEWQQPGPLSSKSLFFDKAYLPSASVGRLFFN
jgi:predicted ATPase